MERNMKRAPAVHQVMVAGARSSPAPRRPGENPPVLEVFCFLMINIFIY